MIESEKRMSERGVGETRLALYNFYLDGAFVYQSSCCEHRHYRRRNGVPCTVIQLHWIEIQQPKALQD